MPIIAAILTACGAASGNPSPTPFPCPLDPQPLPPSLLYPADGSTGVPDGNFQLVIGYPTQPTVQLTLVSASATPIALPAVVPDPSPSPSPLPTAFPATEFFSTPVPPLQALTAYKVTYLFGTASRCNQPQSIGTFTTK